MDTRYVAAEPEIVQAPRSDLVRRQDVIDQVAGLVDIYRQQQATALQAVQSDATRGGYLSSADQVRERRKLTRLYLLTYSGVSALTVGGLAYLAMLAGADGASSLAGWMAGTGALTLALTWVRHGDEFRHSPEGIARHVIDAHWSLSEYEAETRRKAIAWEHQAEARRQEATAQAAADARQMAALRMQEMETRRRAIEADNERRQARQAAWVEDRIAQTVQDAHSAAPSVAQAQNDLRNGNATQSAPIAVCAGENWQAALTAWVADLYSPGATTENGVIKGRVPWAARSAWAESDKAHARRVCVELRPALIVASDGGRWRLRVEMFGDADIALRLLVGRLE